MMYNSRIMKTLIMILIFAAAAFGQTPSPTPGYSDSDDPKQPTASSDVSQISTTEALRVRAKPEKLKNLTIKYDKFKDQTRISFEGFSNVDYTIGTEYNGESLRRNANDFYIYFYGGSRCYGFCFHDPELILIVDGERTFAGTDEGLSDSAIFSIDRKMLERLAAAKLVEFQVGRYEGKWKDKDIENFKTLLGLATVIK